MRQDRNNAGEGPAPEEWTAYLDGKISREEAVARIIEGVVKKRRKESGELVPRRTASSSS